MLFSRFDEKEIRKMEFGETVVSADGFPQIPVRAEGSQQWRYLSPYAGYKFQVSGNADGDWDYGSNEVIGLKNLVETYMPLGGRSSACVSNMSRSESIKYILAQLAYAAVAYYSTGEECTDYGSKVCTVDPYLFCYGAWRSDEEQGKNIDKFIDETYNYISRI